MTFDIEEGTSSEMTETSHSIDSPLSTSVSSSVASVNPRRLSFVDYVPPPATSVPPPAKYKLWIMIIVCVFFAEWLSSEAGIIPWLEDTFALSFNGALLILLGTIVGVLVYASLDLMIKLTWIKIRGEWYGIGTWLRQPRVQWVHEYENSLVDLIAGIVVIFEDGFAMFNSPHVHPEDHQPKQFDYNEDHPVVLKIENRIRPDKRAEHKAWLEKFSKQGCHHRPGILDYQHEVVQDSIKGDLHVCYLTFESIDYLNTFMTSPVRARFMRSLHPLLVTPTLVQLQKDRILPDAFTDLCNRQGQAVPLRQPKKWKVWWITTLSLFIVSLFTNATLADHSLEVWGLYDAHDRALSIVRIIFNTFLNSYVMTPFMTMIFGDWLKRFENEDNPREPWRSLNDGVSSTYGKMAIVLAFHGGCALAWILREV